MRTLHIVLWLTAFLLAGGSLFAQPNDDCTNATLIPVPGGGWGFGSVISDTVDLTTATLETGEFVHPIQVAQDKSVWYRFSIPTTRNVRIILNQPGPPYSMSPVDAGWTLFRTTGCLPGAAEVVDPPILNIEGYTHECLNAGDYLLQVTGTFTASGPVYVELQLSPSNANETDYDYSAAPYNFGVVSGINLVPASLNHFYDVGCQSIHSLETTCPDSTFTQSTWHVFTTDNFVDYVRFELNESPWNNLISGNREWGFRLYEGNCITDSIPDNGPGLNTIDSCRTLIATAANSYATQFYNCDLNPNTTYSIQLFHPTDYSGQINVRMYETGSVATIAPDPNNIPPSHQLGTLAYNVPVTSTDYFACNSRMSLYNCPPAVQDTVNLNNTDYDLNMWLTFDIPIDGNVRFTPNYLGCRYNSPAPRFRLFAGDVNAVGCAGLVPDTTFVGSLYYNCLPAGTWSVQILGQNNPDQAHTCNSNMSQGVQLTLELDQVAPMAYGLFTPQEIDSINGGNALVSGTTYNSNWDYFDCRTTFLPAGDHCGTTNDRAIYRLIYIGQDGILSVGGGNWSRFRYRLYRGNASTAPVVGNELQGLVDQAGCQSTYYPFKVCVTPGYYTLVSYGDVQDVTYGDRPWIQFESFPPTQFTDPLNPEQMDTLGNANASLIGTPTHFNCTDNPLTILGHAPCGSSTKQIYREFYLDSPQLVTLTHNFAAHVTNAGTIWHRLFSGRISQSSLTGMVRDCGGNFTLCLQPGWYTIVTYGTGNTFPTPPYTGGRGGSIGDQTGITLTINPNQQQFEAFAVAEQVNGGNPIFWEADIPGGHTAQIPRNEKTYTLGTEYWVCADNLPFEAGITACNPSHNRVSYRVFTLSKPSHVFIDGLNPYPYNHQSRVYLGDITAQTPPFSIVQDCISDDIRLCLDPGVYTLVTFAGDQNIGRTLTPTIYLDSLGVSRFDHAANAYEFGLIPNDSLEYLGNPADAPGPFGRAASTDFFFCTTGAQASDPRNVCPIGQSPPPNSLPSPTNPRRNLWYSFQVAGPGQVEVSVYNQTLGKPNRSPFAIYRSDDLIRPPVDSTLADGLTLVNHSTTWYCGNYQTVSFFRDPCSALDTTRYYILVDKNTRNGAYYEPNTQIEVGVRFIPSPPAFVAYDHYSQANVINGNPTLQCNAPYTPDTLISGTFTGCLGNLNCATQDPTDQNTCGTRTIWYTFEAGSSGRISINYDRPDSSTHFNDNDIQLYRAVVLGDSTSSGLVRVPLNTINRSDNPDFEPGISNIWGQGCYEPGRYYLMFTGCNYPTETVLPRIWLEPYSGDLCTDPLVLNVDTTGVFRATAFVDCFTIGEAPGEDGSNMGCLDGPVGLKSAWFQVNLTDTSADKWDINISLDEYTQVTGDQIRYRIANGDCNAMTFDNCVEDGAFIVLNLKCRPVGPFWVQVVLPDYATDSIALNVDVSPAPDTSCLIVDPNRPRADFDVVAGCTDELVLFTNNSTTGPGVTYSWNFGDGFGSTLMHPTHAYAVADTYLVSLIVDNGIFRDTLIRPVITYPRPETHFDWSPPTGSYFVGNPITFNDLTTNAIPTATYFWDFCAGPPPCGTSPTSFVGPNPPPVVWNTTGWKVTCLTVVNGNCDSTFCDSLFISDTTIWAGGPYDGFDLVRGGDSCLTNEMEIWAGGPYDGHDFAFLTDSCSRLVVNVFAGGPYDGHGNDFLTDSCSNLTINVFAGGPYDGHGYDLLSDSCLAGRINVFAGGPYDGHGFDAIRELCAASRINVFAGGPFDGHGHDFIADSCASTEINIWAGGPYDGFDHITMICDSLVSDSTDTTFCDTCFWAGGPYDGAAVAVIRECSSTDQNVFAGGPYDGHDYAFLSDSCNAVSLNVFAGGPYDGHDHAFLSDSCSSFNLNVFAGGPFDGHSTAFMTDSCSNFVINVFAGGPYDGHDYAFHTDSCSSFLINVFAGGPYDGHACDRIYLNDTTPFFVQGDTVCIGSPATFTASAPTQWFISDGNNGYLFVGGTSSTFTTPVFYSAGIYDFYVEDPFKCMKYLVQATVLDTLANPDFVVNPGCAPNDTTFFTNQSIIPGPPLPSFGGAGFPVTSQGMDGVPPPATQISFSSVLSSNFNLLSNGVNDQQLGWTASNAVAPATQWVQWQYLTPKSVNRFYYWPRNNCCPDKGPTELRLYYDDGSGWVQVKRWNPPYPSNANFDTGFFFETANIYARRWKLETDVAVAQAPSWGEFQLFASDPTIGGNAIWNFGDGNTSTVFDPQHIYGTGGTYNVSLTMDQPGVLCTNGIVQQIVIDNCGPLPFLHSHLDGVLQADGSAVDLLWDVQGYFESGVFQKLADGNWVDLQGFDEDPQLSSYFHTDSEVLIGTPNLYRVHAWDYGGEDHYSNIVEINLGASQPLEVILFPNPAPRGDAHLLLKLPEDSEVGMTAYDLYGRRVLTVPRQQFAAGTHRTTFDVSGLSLGTYLVVVEVNGKVLTKKLVVI